MAEALKVKIVTVPIIGLDWNVHELEKLVLLLDQWALSP